MSDLRLVIFDVDGTLVDSQGDIVGSMVSAFETLGLNAPARREILSIVGLSLDVAMAELAPKASIAQQVDLVAAYKDAYHLRRVQKGSMASSPLYPGARAVLERLRAQDETFLGVATGKSRRGLDGLIAGHGLDGVFTTQQVADHHPSKPHPSMIEAALQEIGVPAERAVMIGDTSFDMDMAKAAGVTAIGVTWGYHDRTRLTAADHIAETFEEIPPLIETLLG